MQGSGQYIVVYMVEPQAIGSYFDRSRWPLHITLLPWTNVSDAQNAAMRHEFQQLCETMAPFTFTTGETALFGPNKDKTVHVIADQRPLQAIHTALLSVVNLLHLDIQDKTYIGDKHIAHITERPGRRRIETGDVMSFDGFYVVQLLKDNICQILTYYPFKGGSDA